MRSARPVKNRPLVRQVPERNHLLLIVSFSFLVGCLLSFELADGPWLWGLVCIALLLWAALRRLGADAGVAIALCFFALGAVHAKAAYQTVQPAPGDYEISGFVCGGTRRQESGRLTFTLTNITLDGMPAVGRAYCSLRYEEAPPVLFDGAEVHMTGRVYLPDGKAGEPHMDFRLWMRQNGLSFGISVFGEPSVLNTAETAPIKDAAYRARQGFGRALERRMGDRARVAMALLLGERGGLTREEYQAFQTLGVAHVMSVSGLHVSLLGGLLLWALKRLRIRRRLRLPVLALFLWGYCALTGFSAASVRAAVTLMLILLARLCARRPDRLTTLAAAMLAVLVVNPLNAKSAGFVLSFSAMLGITLLSPPLSRLMNRLWPPMDQGAPFAAFKHLLRRFQRGLTSLVTLSVAAQAGVLLPTAMYFHQLPLYGVIINLLIVPLAGALLTPLCAVTLLFSPVPVAGAALGGASSLLVDLLLRLVELLSALPGAAVRVAAPPVPLAVGLALGCVMLTRRVPGRLARRAAAAMLAASVALAGAYLSRPANPRYIQLAVGQADAALILDGDRTILIDAGSDGQAALHYLLREGRDVDALFITHLHMDHIGGVAALLDSGIQIRQAYIPVNATLQRADPGALLLLDRLRAGGTPVAELACGDELRYNTTSVTALWPVRERVRTGQDANDLPLVLSIGFGGYRILSASDLAGAYESYAAAPADVLKVAHHGSSFSTGDAFLAAVSPRVALVSCSSGSRSLPGEDTLGRLADSGATVLRTDECGDITLTLRDGELRVIPYKARCVP